ncbi:MAG: 4Fe-4S cluster-binding domain-containing protein [Clostridium sp.]
MLKYVDTLVSFSEVPDEISLCINISNCPCHCKNCHSSYLAEDIGEPLTINELRNLIQRNEGVTCICFMGGDSDHIEIDNLARWVQIFMHHKYKIAWYSGRQELSKDINLKWFDFIKLGPYIEELGSLNSKSTNQRFYKVEDNKLIDITYKFQKSC